MNAMIGPYGGLYFNYVKLVKLCLIYYQLLLTFSLELLLSYNCPYNQRGKKNTVSNLKHKSQTLSVRGIKAGNS